jgi:hypothetical protein
MEAMQFTCAESFIVARTKYGRLLVDRDGFVAVKDMTGTRLIFPSFEINIACEDF